MYKTICVIFKNMESLKNGDGVDDDVSCRVFVAYYVSISADSSVVRV